MREILFRGKIRYGKEWIYGSAVNQKNYHGSNIDKLFIIDGNDMDCPDIFYQYYEYEADEKTLCMYTGLLDKNGTKIFEGDVVEVPMKNWAENNERLMRGVVEYKNAAFHVTWFEEMYGRHFIGYLEDVEVIGNKFDNPELIP